MDTNLDTVDADTRAGAFLKDLPKRPFATYYLVVSGGKISGVVKRDKLIEAAGYDETAKIDDVAERNYVTVTEDFSFLAVVERLRSKRAPIALVVTKEGDDSPGNVKGIITREQIGQARMETIELLAD